MDELNGEKLLDYGPSDMRIPIKYALTYRGNIDLGMDEFAKNAAELDFFVPNDHQNEVFKIGQTVAPI